MQRQDWCSWTLPKSYTNFSHSAIWTNISSIHSEVEDMQIDDMNFLLHKRRNVALMKIYANIVEDVVIKLLIVARNKIGVFSRQRTHQVTRMLNYNRDCAVRLFYALSQLKYFYVSSTFSLLYYITISWLKEPPYTCFTRFNRFSLFSRWGIYKTS